MARVVSWNNALYLTLKLLDGCTWRFVEHESLGLVILTVTLWSGLHRFHSFLKLRLLCIEKDINPSNFTKFLKHVVARDKVKDKISHINSRTVTDGLLALWWLHSSPSKSLVSLKEAMLAKGIVEDNVALFSSRCDLRQTTIFPRCGQKPFMCYIKSNNTNAHLFHAQGQYKFAPSCHTIFLKGFVVVMKLQLRIHQGVTSVFYHFQLTLQIFDIECTKGSISK